MSLCFSFFCKQVFNKKHVEHLLTHFSNEIMMVGISPLEIGHTVKQTTPFSQSGAAIPKISQRQPRRIWQGS